MHLLWLGCLCMATVGLASSQDTDKRAPRPDSFAAMRGKKDYDYDSMGYYYDKRVPMGFAGMRGKKLYDDGALYESKRAPARSFFAVKGKREFLNPADVSNYNDIQVQDIEKRAPARFFGMRGKKGPSSQSFFGMRGKKDNLYEWEPYWYSKAGYSSDMAELLNMLNAGISDSQANRAKRDVSEFADRLNENSVQIPLSPQFHHISE